MNRCYWKFAVMVVSGSAAFWMLAGCSTQAPRSQDQAYSTTTTSYSSQQSQGAPVYASDSDWQYGYKPAKPAKTGMPMNEAAGSQAQSQQQQAAPIDNSSSQWQSADADQKLETPRASDQGQPHSAQGQPNANIQPHNTAPMASQSYTTSSSRPTQWVTSTPMITEGPNSGGRWHPGLVQQTLQPDATWSNGWLIGYSNPNYEPPKVIVREAAGSAATSSTQQQWNEQQQQLNRQQQEIYRQQQEIRQLQQQMKEHQQSQSAPSNNSTSP